MPVIVKKSEMRARLKGAHTILEQVSSKLTADDQQELIRIHITLDKCWDIINNVLQVEENE